MEYKDNIHKEGLNDDPYLNEDIQHSKSAIEALLKIRELSDPLEEKDTDAQGGDQLFNEGYSLMEKLSPDLEVAEYEQLYERIIQTFMEAILISIRNNIKEFKERGLEDDAIFNEITTNIEKEIEKAKNNRPLLLAYRRVKGQIINRFEFPNEFSDFKSLLQRIKDGTITREDLTLIKTLYKAAKALSYGASNTEETILARYPLVQKYLLSLRLLTSYIKQENSNKRKAVSGELGGTSHLSKFDVSAEAGGLGGSTTKHPRPRRLNDELDHF